jgi:hypothetical protein
MLKEEVERVAETMDRVLSGAADEAASMGTKTTAI